RGPGIAPDRGERAVQDLADAERPQRDDAGFRRLGLARPGGVGPLPRPARLLPRPARLPMLGLAGLPARRLAVAPGRRRRLAGIERRRLAVSTGLTGRREPGLRRGRLALPGAVAALGHVVCHV